MKFNWFRKEEKDSIPVEQMKWRNAHELYFLLAHDREGSVITSRTNVGESEHYYYFDLQEHMTRVRSSATKVQFLMNDETEEAWMILAPNGMLRQWGEKDIDFARVDTLDNVEYVHALHAKFWFSIGDFKNGVAQVHWTAYPDGQYFADEDGFGAESNSEVNIYAYTDRSARIVVPFQPMNKEEKERWRTVAEGKV